MEHCVLSVVFPSIFLCGVYSVCGGGNSQARFWVWIVSIHCTDCMGFSVLIFEIVLRCGAGCVSFVGHCVLSFVFRLSFCGVYSICGGGNFQAWFWILIVSIHCAACMGFSVLIFQIEFECGAG